MVVRVLPLWLPSWRMARDAVSPFIVVLSILVSKNLVKALITRSNDWVMVAD